MQGSAVAISPLSALASLAVIAVGGSSGVYKMLKF